jgi:hypothetical protein
MGVTEMVTKTKTNLYVVAYARRGAVIGHCLRRKEIENLPREALLQIIRSTGGEVVDRGNHYRLYTERDLERWNFTKTRSENEDEALADADWILRVDEEFLEQNSDTSQEDRGNEAA